MASYAHCFDFRFSNLGFGASYRCFGNIGRICIGLVIPNHCPEVICRRREYILIGCMKKQQHDAPGKIATSIFNTVRKQLGSIVAIVSQSAPPFFWETSGPELHELAIQIKYVIYGVPLLEFFLCFSSCIFSGAVSCSCIPVANSSCKFYLHWGKHSQAQKKVNKVQVD